MDGNKLQVLRDIDYEIKTVCGNCKFSDFRYGSQFGTCSTHTYEHEKHTGPRRDLSINMFGSCDSWEIHPDYNLNSWEEFLKVS